MIPCVDSDVAKSSADVAKDALVIVSTLNFFGDQQPAPPAEPLPDPPAEPLPDPPAPAPPEVFVVNDTQEETADTVEMCDGCADNIRKMAKGRKCMNVILVRSKMREDKRARLS